MAIQAKPFVTIGLFISCTACTDFLAIDPPINQVVAENVFSTDEAALSALTGLYSETMATNSYFLNGGITLYGGLSAGELANRQASDTREEFARGEISPTNSDNDYRLWRTAYAMIYRCNSLLEGATSNALSPSAKQLIRGEALLYRALCYFYLVNLYGDVPWVTSTDSEANTVIPRTPSAAIYSGIEADLLETEQLLSADYPVENRARPNKHTAQALLARLYVFLGQWEKAESYANRVLSASQYRLEEQLDNVYRYNSREVIWQLYPVNNTFKATAEAQVFLPSASASSLPQLVLSAAVLDAFEKDDQRLEGWVGSKTYLGNTYYFPHKYRIRRGEDVREEYNVLFRLAEQYFIRSEARMNLGNLPGAIDDLNSIRQRAGLAPLAPTGGQPLMDALMQEKNVEFFAECGHRWLDLKRWGLVERTWYPIPQYELDSNPMLVP